RCVLVRGRPPRPPLFPYTTLVRSHHEGDPVTGTYRTQAEVDEWLKRDPIQLLRGRLLDDFGTASADELGAIDARIDKIVQASLEDRKSTRLNSSHVKISYAVFCLK